jgi:hypothetical protein
LGIFGCWGCIRRCWHHQHCNTIISITSACVSAVATTHSAITATTQLQHVLVAKQHNTDFTPNDKPKKPKTPQNPNPKP